MLWSLKQSGGRPPQSLSAHIERRLQFALARFSGRIQRVNVFLQDQNGPRGGVDKTCRIVVRLRDGGDLVAEVVDACWEGAVDRATTRVGNTVSREVARLNASRRISRSDHPLASTSIGGRRW